MIPRQGNLKGMSRKNKRQLHKNRAERQEKKRKQQEYRRQKYFENTVKKVEQNKVNITYGHKKRKTKVDYRQEKINWLIDQGYDNPLAEFTLREIDSLHIADIRKGTLLAENVPFLNKNKVNFNRVKLLQDTDGRPLNLKIAYRSLSWNNTLTDIIPRYTNLSNDKLVELAKNLLQLPRTYRVGLDGVAEEGSSGKDGEIEFRVAVPDDFAFFDMNVKDIRNRNRKNYNAIQAGVKRKRVHSGDKYNVQYVSLHGKTAIDRMSFRECLIIYCAMAENVTEKTRKEFDNHYYNRLMDIVFAEELRILDFPKPSW